MEYSPLHSLCESITDCPHSTPEWTTSGKVVIRNQNIKNGKLDLSSPSYTTAHDFQRRIIRAKPSTGDIIITREAPMGEACLVPEGLECCLGQRMVLLKPDDKKCNNKYLLYAILSPYVQHQISWSFGTGTTVSNLRIPHLETLKIPCPDRNVQDSIAATLSSLDDKIELNNRIIANLEAQAQAIFKSWFVDFEPWGGKVPTSWKNSVLGEHIEIKRGGSPRPIQEFLATTGLRWLKISDVTNLDTPFVYKIKERIKESGLKKTVFLKAGALVLSNSATPGIPKILGVDSCIHDGWLYFSKSEFTREFLYLFFKYIREDLITLGNGSIFTNLKTEILKRYPICKPDEEILGDFQRLIKPCFDLINNITLETASLETIRDVLLPKLMTGKIEVKVEG